MVGERLLSELPTICVSVTEAFFSGIGFFLPVAFFVVTLDLVADVVLLLSPVLPAGNESFTTFC